VNRGQEARVGKPNRIMKSSCGALDGYGQCLARNGEPSESSVDVGKAKALRSVFWDENFKKGGKML
jgi:hypothetical protein